MAGLERETTRARGAAPGFKVAVLGAAGGIGQPLSLLMKMHPLVSTLHLYDVFNTPGVVADLSHTNTSAVVQFPLTLSLTSSLPSLSIPKVLLLWAKLILISFCFLNWNCQF